MTEFVFWSETSCSLFSDHGSLGLSPTGRGVFHSVLNVAHVVILICQRTVGKQPPFTRICGSQQSHELDGLRFAWTFLLCCVTVTMELCKVHRACLSADIKDFDDNCICQTG